ncbi:Na+/H+ antiporter family protein [Actinomyces capricornis]|uniref:Sodium:proton antiporter n=1 Tax=Actinomyces capricornis TaxID=2755559 RepID=A0ABN6K1C5_9ACTO|nr:Na+/H+ antiporter NhaC family protein [Actinomyces capricornis]BDA63400.1 sodium:proton antiporter [Actinomyces capricornis]
MNAVLLAVLVMLLLATLRVHVVLALFVGALVGGLSAGLGIEGTMVAFQEGLANGAKIALSYALLGAFAMSVAHSGLPQLLANRLITRLDAGDASTSERIVRTTSWTLLGGVVAMAIMSQNLIPVHIAFIPLVIPPLLVVMSRLGMDRRAVACAITFGLVTTYMFLPLGFGRVFLHDILYANIESAGLDVSRISPIGAMWLPALGMAVGLLIALLVTYRRPRAYDVEARIDTAAPAQIDRRRIAVALVAVVACFAIQTALTMLDSKADPLLIGTLAGLLLFMATRVVGWREADDVFTGGMRMMALIGLIMITAQGFAQVLQTTGQIPSLVESAAGLFSGNRAAAAVIMLLVGLVITMGIGSSFSTLPIISAIYVPLCMALGFSPTATVALIGTAGALGDAGSPASDSTLGPTAGLNADGQHDHMRDSVIPTFLHFNIPLLIAGWIAAMVL